MKLSTVVPLAAGLAVGYLLGAAAGRGRYQQIKHAAEDLVRNPKVQEKVFNLAEQTKSNSQRLPRAAAEVVDTAATRLQETLTQPGDTGDTEDAGTEATDEGPSKPSPASP